MTNARSPARAAKAAADADVLPVEAQMTAREPASTAFDIAIVMPRSLKDPVGLNPSHLRWMDRLGSVASASRGAGSSGVFPSSNVTTGVFSVTGRYRRERSMIPGQAVTAFRAPASPAQSAGAAPRGAEPPLDVAEPP